MPSFLAIADFFAPAIARTVLPALRAGPLLHIHDIPFPYHCPYPDEYRIYKSVWPMWWNESMLLHALLCGNKQFAVSLSTPLIRYHDEAFLKELIPGSDDRGRAKYLFVDLAEESVTAEANRSWESLPEVAP